MLLHDEGAVLAYLDGELTADERAEFERHLAGCAECEAELSRARADAVLLAGTLPELDAPVDVEAALRTVRRESGHRRTQARVRRLMPYAATLVLGVAGVASATIPGSPLHGWPGAAWERLAARPAAPPPSARIAAVEAEAPTVAATAAAAEAGVSIRAVDGSIRIILVAPSAELRVRARLVPGERADVVAVGEAARARFESAPGMVTVYGAGAGELLIDLPERARVVRVEVDGAVYLTREGDQLRLHRDALTGAASELRFRVGRDGPRSESSP